MAFWSKMFFELQLVRPKEIFRVIFQTLKKNIFLTFRIMQRQNIERKLIRNSEFRMKTGFERSSKSITIIVEVEERSYRREHITILITLVLIM